MTLNPFSHETREQLVDQLLADNGTIWRRARDQNLTEQDFAELMRRTRQRLQRLREIDQEEDPAFVLTDVGAAAAVAEKVGASLKRKPLSESIMRRLGVFTGRDLAAQERPNRGRTVNHLMVIDGDRA